MSPDFADADYPTMYVDNVRRVFSNLRASFEPSVPAYRTLSKRIRLCNTAPYFDPKTGKRIRGEQRADMLREGIKALERMARDLNVRKHVRFAVGPARKIVMYIDGEKANGTR